jgi:hypothetical protein
LDIDMNVERPLAGAPGLAVPSQLKQPPAAPKLRAD